MRTINLLLFLVLLLSPAMVRGALGDHQWSQGWSAGGATAVDAAGNAAVVGAFYGPIDLGGGVLTPGNIFGGDVFVARFDPNGGLLWSHQFTPGGFGMSVTAVACGPGGAIYLTGFLQNADIDFGGGVLTGSNKIVMAAFAPDGSHRWSFVAGDGTVKDLYATDNVVAVTGYTYGTLDFGGGPLTSAGGADVFVGALRPDGSHRSSRVIGDTGDQGGMGVAVLPAEGIVVAATSETDIDFGGGPLTVTGTDLCVAAWDSTDAHLWSWNRAGDFSPGVGILATLDLDVSTTGRLALAGQFNGQVDMGGGLLTANGSDDVFLALYSDSGAHEASANYGGTLSDGAQGVSFDTAGNVALGGTFLSASADFGGPPLMHSGGFGSDWFVAVFDDTGGLLHQASFTGNAQYYLQPRFCAAGMMLSGSGGGGTDFGGGVLPTTELFMAMLDGVTGGASFVPGASHTFELAPNVPNPFNPVTTLRFELATPESRVRLSVLDLRGRLVAVLRDGPAAAGRHESAWRGANGAGQAMPSGVYIARLAVGGDVRQQLMTLVR